MPYAWGDNGGMAALRAQAIAARSYARELMIHRGNPADNLCAAWCHVRDTTWDQRYVGHGHLKENWRTAAQQTAGKVMTHDDAPNQGIVRGYYSSSSGGKTEDIEDVWPWWERTPYYVSRDDHWAVDGTVANPNASWTVTLSNEEVADAVGLSEITDAWVSKRNTSGSANEVKFTDGDTTVTKASSWMRSTFVLNSISFDLSMG
jgi:SpoIID/LytB domain protein